MPCASGISPREERGAALGVPAVPGVVVAADASRAGKTSAVLALVCALRARGLDVRAAKTGPDFIDTAWHAELTGAPAANLDAWMGGAAGLKRLLRRMSMAPATPGGAARPPDMLIVEGAMGLYDGGARCAGSTARTSALLGMPVLLVLDASGMAQSAAAKAQGFIDWGRENVPGLVFAGLVCSHAGGEKHRRLLADALGSVCRARCVPFLGTLPRIGAPKLESRHLGLVGAQEGAGAVDRSALACWIEENCRVDALLRRLGAPLRRSAATGVPAVPRKSPPALSSEKSGEARAFFAPLRRRSPRGARIAIARDDAFRFCYADLPALLREMGAEIVFFSPLADAALPEGCTGLYFPGGYPELFAGALSGNGAMRHALHALAGRGVPVYGECGGFIYLMRTLHCAAGEMPMTGLLPLACRMETRWAALGYRRAFSAAGFPGDGAIAVRAHEFHYARLVSEEMPAGCVPLWRSVRDSAGRDCGARGARAGSVAGSWLHLFPEGSRAFWRAWVDLCTPQKGWGPRA